MGAPYQSQSASNYNSSPPPDDGSTVAANKITWAKIKTALADPVKTLSDAINTALRSALNVSPSTTSVNYTTLVADHLTTIEATGTITISLGDAATMIAQTVGYQPTVYNKGTGTVTVAVITATDTLAGRVNGTVTLPPGAAMTFTVAQSGVGYDIISATGFAPFKLGGEAGTNTATATAPANLLALYNGLLVLWTPANTNTGATTLNVTPSGGSALTAKNVFSAGAACVGGEAKASEPLLLEYDGTQFNIIGKTALVSAAQTFLGSDVALNNASNYFDVITTGSVGASGQKWLVMATAAVTDTAGAASFLVRIWDGSASVYVESEAHIAAATHFNCINVMAVVTLSGATTFTLSVKDRTSTSGSVKTTGNAGTANKETQITAVRIS